MSFRSVARRLAVTLPFFSLAAVVLALSTPDIPESSLAVASPSMVLIVTTESLHPAFRALGMWNRIQGCPSDIVSFEPGTDRHTMLSRLAVLCRERQATGLLLGGNTELVPLLQAPGGRIPPASPGSAPRILPVPSPRAGLMPKGMTVGRAPVGDLTEAWAFVNACRSSGRTLDQLMSASVSFAAVPGREPATFSRSLLYSALARSIR